MNPKACIRKTPPISDTGIATTGTRTERKEPRNRKDDDHDDHQRIAQGFEHLPYGIGDVVGGIIGDAGLEPDRQVPLDGRHLRLYPFDDVDGIGVGERPDPDPDRGLAGIADVGIVVFGPQHHVGDVADPDDGPVLLAHHQPLELLDRAQVRVGGQVDLDECPLAPADGGKEVVGGQGLAYLGGADVLGRHPIGLEPDAHGERAGAEDVGPLYPLDGGKTGLNDAHQVVGDLVLLQDVRTEAQIGGGELAVGRLDVDNRHLRLRGQVATHLVHLGADLGQGLGGIVVKPEAHVDRGEAEGALRFHVIDAVGGGDGALQRRSNETAHQVGAGADVDGGDGDRRVLAVRVLTDV